jgi:hypothetical protein
VHLLRFHGQRRRMSRRVDTDTTPCSTLVPSRPDPQCHIGAMRTIERQLWAPFGTRMVRSNPCRPVSYVAVVSERMPEVRSQSRRHLSNVSSNVERKPGNESKLDRCNRRHNKCFKLKVSRLASNPPWRRVKVLPVQRRWAQLPSHPEIIATSRPSAG